MLAHTKENFYAYPTHRVVGVVDTKNEADVVVSELIDAGFDDSQIDESIGDDGLAFLDPVGDKHGLWTKLIRKWQHLAQGEEHKYLERVEKDLKEGHAIISVPTLNKVAREKVANILRAHHAKSIRYYGRLYVEHLDGV
ncbi:MAG: hypothetical protein AAEF72_01530 [Gammaproteobacteria bacterium]